MTNYLIRGAKAYGGDAADSARSTIVEQVANGVSVRMAVLYLLLSGAPEVPTHERLAEPALQGASA